MKLIQRMRMGEQVTFTADFPRFPRSQPPGKLSEIVMGMKSILSDTFFKMEQVIKNFSFNGEEDEKLASKSAKK